MADDTLRPTAAIADPAPLGLAAFALTTFILSAHNAGWAPDLAWLGPALFYGGLAQFLAGMWEFRNRNTFGSTAFTTYGAFWLSLAAFVVLDLFGKVPASVNVAHASGWFVLGFAIFNTYMLLWSATVNRAVFGVFLTLEITEILLFIGYFANQSAGHGLLMIGGWVGVLTALVAWYASAAGVVNAMAQRPGPPGRRAALGPVWRAHPPRQPDPEDRGHQRTVPGRLTGAWSLIAAAAACQVASGAA